MTTEINELSKGTLGRYIKKAAASGVDNERDRTYHARYGEYDKYKSGTRNLVNRSNGIDKAVKRLTHPEYGNAKNDYAVHDVLPGRTVQTTSYMKNRGEAEKIATLDNNSRIGSKSDIVSKVLPRKTKLAKGIKEEVKVNDPSLKHRLKHVIVKHPDRNGNGDDVFNAANIKTIDRSKERHGYNPGEDAEIYEEDLSEIVHPENKEAHAKACAHLKDLRKYKRLGIDHPKLGRKVKNSDIAGAEMAVDKITHVKVKDLSPHGKIGEEAVTKQTPLNELSKGLLGRYIRRATNDLDIHSYRQGKFDTHMNYSNGRSYDAYRNTRDKSMVKAARRSAGISKAVNRLTKEDLDEAYDSGHVGDIYHHTPEGAAKLKQIRDMVRAHNKKMVASGKHDEQLKVLARGRLGKNNPNKKLYGSSSEVYAAKRAGIEKHHSAGISPKHAERLAVYVQKKKKRYDGRYS